MLRPGDSLGAFRVQAELGEGGAGRVLHVRDAQGRDLALKLLGRQAGEKAERFAREVRLLGELSSEGGFVPLLDSGQLPQGPYLLMPLMAFPCSAV